jgi:hypothetical protein
LGLAPSTARAADEITSTLASIQFLPPHWRSFLDGRREHQFPFAYDYIIEATFTQGPPHRCWVDAIRSGELGDGKGLGFGAGHAKHSVLHGLAINRDEPLCPYGTRAKCLILLDKKSLFTVPLFPDDQSAERPQGIASGIHPERTLALDHRRTFRGLVHGLFACTSNGKMPPQFSLERSLVFGIFRFVCVLHFPRQKNERGRPFFVSFGFIASAISMQRSQ